jgi:hypothetical protein
MIRSTFGGRKSNTRAFCEREASSSQGTLIPTTSFPTAGKNSVKITSRHFALITRGAVAGYPLKLRQEWWGLPVSDARYLQSLQGFLTFVCDYFMRSPSKLTQNASKVGKL